MDRRATLGMRNMNMESLYEYGSRAGFWRLYRAFTQRGLSVTVYAVSRPPLLRRKRDQARLFDPAASTDPKLRAHLERRVH